MHNKRLTFLLITSAVAGGLAPPVIFIVFALLPKWRGASWILVGYIFLVLIFEQTIVEMGNVSFIEYAIFMGLSGVVMGISSFVVMFLTCEVGGMFVGLVSTAPACTFHRGLYGCLLVAVGYLFFTMSTYKLFV